MLQKVHSLLISAKKKCQYFSILHFLQQNVYFLLNVKLFSSLKNCITCRENVTKLIWNFAKISQNWLRISRKSTIFHEIQNNKFVKSLFAATLPLPRHPLPDLVIGNAGVVPWLGGRWWSKWRGPSSRNSNVILVADLAQCYGSKYIEFGTGSRSLA